jgi:hypothetical protein
MLQHAIDEKVSIGLDIDEEYVDDILKLKSDQKYAFLYTASRTYKVNSNIFKVEADTIKISNC